MQHSPPPDLSSERILRDSRWMRAMAHALTSDAHAIDDLVQETWLAALRHERVNESRRYFWGTLRSLAFRRRRGEERRARREKDAESPGDVPSTAELVERTELQQVLGEAMLSLDEPMRTTVMLCFVEGLSADRIAEIQGIATRTVRWRLKEGLNRMRDHLTRRHGRDWSSWCALLIPWIEAGKAPGLAHPPLLRTGFRLGTLLPRVLAASLVVVTTFVGFQFLGDRGNSSTPAVSSEDSVFAERPPPIEPTSIAERLSVDPVTEDLPTVADPIQLSTTVRGQVTGAGEPLVGATVYAMSPAAVPTLIPTEPLAQTITDARGRYELRVPSESLFDIGATHNGFVRQMVLDIDPKGHGAAFDIDLPRGGRVRGVLVSHDGGTLGGVPVLLCSTYAAFDDYSTTDTLDAARRLRLAPRDSRYYDSCTVTNDNGAFEFNGLSEQEPYVLLSGSSQWLFFPPRECRAGDEDVVQSAVQSLSIELTVLDSETGEPLETCSAVIRFGLNEEDKKAEPPSVGDQPIQGHQGIIGFNAGVRFYDRIVRLGIKGHAVYSGFVRAEGYKWKPFEYHVPYSSSTGLVKRTLHLDPLTETTQAHLVAFRLLDHRGALFEREVAVLRRHESGQIVDHKLSRGSDGLFRGELPAGDHEILVCSKTSLVPLDIDQRLETVSIPSDFEVEGGVLERTFPMGASVRIHIPQDARQRRVWQLDLTHDKAGYRWIMRETTKECILEGLIDGVWQIEVRPCGYPFIPAHSMQVSVGVGDSLDVHFP